jgi:protein-L-isoaspartate O-methyltransferase
MPTAPASAETIKDVNVRYHDVAAADYDSKWGISYGENGRRQVIGKLSKALGQPLGHYDRALEVGAGTGYFSLNLMRAGVIRQAVATDISQGMLDALSDSARRLGLKVETARTEAAALPFRDDSFDLVFGHAILHHLPDLDAVRVSGEELVAGWFGWANRTLESTAEARQLPQAWFAYAYHGYLALKSVDERLLEPRLPPALFYNLLVSARVPGEASASAGRASANGHVAAAAR